MRGFDLKLFLLYNEKNSYYREDRLDSWEKSMKIGILPAKIL